MTSELAPTPTDLTGWPTERLKEELATAMQVSATGLLRLAMVWSELERRGEDLTAVRTTFGRWLPRVATGVLLPELVIQFAGRPSVLDAVAALPVTEQRQVAGGKRYALPGEPKPLPVPFMTASQVRELFRNGQVNDTPAGLPKKRAKPARKYRVVVDRDTRTVRVGKAEVPLEEVIAALALAAGDADRVSDADLMADAKRHGTGIAVAACHLTADEDERLKAACKARKLDRGEAVRRAVVGMMLL